MFTRFLLLVAGIFELIHQCQQKNLRNTLSNFKLLQPISFAELQANKSTKKKKNSIKTKVKYFFEILQYCRKEMKIFVNIVRMPLGQNSMRELEIKLI